MNLFLENVYKMLETPFPDFQKLYWQWLRNGEGKERLAFTHWGIAPWKGGLFSPLWLPALLLSKHDLSHSPSEWTKDNDLESVTRQTKVIVLTMIFFA